MAKTLHNVRTLPSGSRQARIFINGKPLPPKTFRKGTLDSEIVEWVEQQTERYGKGADVETDSFAADVAAYLQRPKVARMASYARVKHALELWLAELGRDRTTRSIETDEVNVVIAKWLDEGLATETVRNRCTSLQSLWTALLPKRQHPFVRSDKPKQPRALQARGLNFALAERALATMPDYGPGGKHKPARRSLSKIVARIMLHSGLPPSVINGIHEEELDLVNGTVTCQRHKGAGIEPRTIPLTEDALAAFQDFHDEDGYGKVPKRANECVARAYKRVGIKGARYYDLRHTFLTELYRERGDLGTVARLALHADGSRETSRYARAANADVDRAAVQALSKRHEKRRAERPKQDQAASRRRTFQIVEPVRVTRGKDKGPRKRRAS